MVYSPVPIILTLLSELIELKLNLISNLKQDYFFLNWSIAPDAQVSNILNLSASFKPLCQLV